MTFKNLRIANLFHLSFRWLELSASYWRYPSSKAFLLAHLVVFSHVLSGVLFPTFFTIVPLAAKESPF